MSKATAIDPFLLGTAIDDVVLNIDYQIIEHFSEHLYGSPNKAVEELIANSFDAAATKVWVYVPGTHTEKYVVVWDDGNGMDQPGLHELWWIARSPKSTGSSLINTP